MSSCSQTRPPACNVPTRQNLVGLETNYQTVFQDLRKTEMHGDSFGMLFAADKT